MVTYFFFIIFTMTELRRYKSFNGTNPLNFAFVQIFTSQFLNLVYLLFPFTERNRELLSEVSDTLSGPPLFSQWKAPSFTPFFFFFFSQVFLGTFAWINNFVFRSTGLFNEILWVFSTPSTQLPAQNNLFPNPACSPHVQLFHHTGSSFLADPQMVLSPCALLLVYLFQPLFIPRLSSMPAALLASKQAFTCLVLQGLPSLYFHPKLQVALCTLCALCRKHSSRRRNIPGTKLSPSCPYGWAGGQSGQN